MAKNNNVVIWVLSIVLILSIIVNGLFILGFNEESNKRVLEIMEWCDYSNKLVSFANMQTNNLKEESEEYGYMTLLEELDCFAIDE